MRKTNWSRRCLSSATSARVPHHWTTIANGAAFGTDYLTRIAVAKSNVFVNRNNETKYFYQDLDADGLRLDGSKSYEITFAAGALPPTDGFWSLTLYDENHALHQNELERYSLGTKNNRLRKNADGSLTIVVQNWPPAAGEQANWLPAPAGKFSLYLRAYGPKARTAHRRLATAAGPGPQRTRRLRRLTSRTLSRREDSAKQ